MQSSEGLPRPGIRKAVQHGLRCGHGGQREGGQSRETNRNPLDGKAFHSVHRAQQRILVEQPCAITPSKATGLLQKEGDSLRYRRLATGVDSRLWEISDMVAMTEEWERESAAQD